MKKITLNTYLDIVSKYKKSLLLPYDMAKNTRKDGKYWNESNSNELKKLPIYTFFERRNVRNLFTCEKLSKEARAQALRLTDEELTQCIENLLQDYAQVLIYINANEWELNSSTITQAMIELTLNITLERLLDNGNGYYFIKK